MADSNWNSSLYDQKHSFVFEYGKDLLPLLNPQPGERILDVGCGTGHLTSQIAATGATVIGIDSSPAMIATARAAYPAIEFQQADATDFSFPDSFDAIFSNAVLHWINAAEKAVQSMSQALRSGGRLVIEFGGKGCVANILQALETALAECALGEVAQHWYFPSVGEYAPLLEKHGFEVNQAFLFDRPTRLEGEDGMLNWLRMFAAIKTPGLSVDEQDKAFNLAVEKLRDVQCVAGQWYADYRRLRIVARKI